MLNENIHFPPQGYLSIRQPAFISCDFLLKMLATQPTNRQNLSGQHNARDKKTGLKQKNRH